MYKILDESKIEKESFHGGAMNGVLCQHLLDNVDVIFGKIGKMGHDCVSANTICKEPIDHNTLDTVLDKFLHLFETMDIVFLMLCICCHTEDKVEKIEQSIKVSEKQWNDLQLTHTPKFHILVNHTAAQIQKFGEDDRSCGRLCREVS